MNILDDYCFITRKQDLALSFGRKSAFDNLAYEYDKCALHSGLCIARGPHAPPTIHSHHRWRLHKLCAMTNNIVLQNWVKSGANHFAPKCATIWLDRFFTPLRVTQSFYIYFSFSILCIHISFEICLSPTVHQKKQKNAPKCRHQPISIAQVAVWKLFLYLLTWLRWERDL